MQFRVRLFDATAAAVREELLEAESPAAAAERLLQAGLVVLSIQAAAAHKPTSSNGPKLDVAWWCRELRTLLAAGLAVVEALETLNAQ